MKQYKLIEVVQNGAASEPADVETWGDKQHVTRINELATDGWHILSIHTHNNSLYVYLEKKTCIWNSENKKYYVKEVRPGVWAVYNSEVLEKYCNTEASAISLAAEMNNNYEKVDEQ